jgi:hypothetical protein
MQPRRYGVSVEELRSQALDYMRKASEEIRLATLAADFESRRDHNRRSATYRFEAAKLDAEAERLVRDEGANVRNSEWIRVGNALPIVSQWSLPYSAEVLATNGKLERVAYLCAPYHEDDAPHWKVAGRDGYDFPNVTHWRPLPPLPTLAE